MVQKKCKKCGEIKPATSEYFYVVKRKYSDGLHGTCKVCKKKQVKKVAAKRFKERRHLIHELTCEWCGIMYMADNKKQRFCSTDCHYDWMQSEEYKVEKTEKANQQYIKTLREREESFKERFDDRFKNFRYHSGYTNALGNFNRECIVCGNVDSANARILHRDTDIECPKCRKAETEKRQAERQAERKRQLKIRKEQRRIEKEIRDRIKPEIDKLERIASNHRYYQECNECGRWFFNRLKKKTCSIKCEKRRQNRHQEINRRRKIRENGRIDWDINIQRLIQRDGLTCHICGEQVDLDDFYTNDNDIFIAGEMYPSIDHVKPVSKGGTHTWDNVKIAHRTCNSVKSDKRVYRNGAGQAIVAF